MKKKNKRIVLVVGLIILVIFTYISYINIVNTSPEIDLDSSKYIGDIDDKSARIDSLKHENGKLKIDVENTKAICVKSTKSIPSINSICWERITNNTFSTSIYEYKMYYIWLLDSNNNIKEPIIYDPNNKY